MPVRSLCIIPLLLANLVGCRPRTPEEGPPNPEVQTTIVNFRESGSTTGGGITLPGDEEMLVAETEPAENLASTKPRSVAELHRKMDELSAIRAAHARYNQQMLLQPQKVDYATNPRLHELIDQLDDLNVRAVLHEGRYYDQFHIGPRREGPYLEVWCTSNTRWSERREWTINNVAATLTKAVPLLNRVPQDLHLRLRFDAIYAHEERPWGEELEPIAELQHPFELYFHYGRMSDEGMQAIAKAGQLIAFSEYFSHLSGSQLKTLCQNNALQYLWLSNNGDVTPEDLISLGTLAQLRFLKLTIGNREQSDSVLQATKNCERLEHFKVNLHQDDVSEFIKQPGRHRLKTLSLINRSQVNIVHQHKLGGCEHLPNLEHFAVTLTPYYAYSVVGQMRRLTENCRNLKTITIGMPRNSDEFVPLAGTDANEVISYAARCPNLKQISVAMKFDSVEQLRPLALLMHMEYLPTNGLSMNREVLAIAAQMPALRRLDFDEMDFGEESAHLFPWLSTVEKLYFDDGHTLTDERLNLLTRMPALNFMYWNEFDSDEASPASRETWAKLGYVVDPAELYRFFKSGVEVETEVIRIAGNWYGCY